MAGMNPMGGMGKMGGGAAPIAGSDDLDALMGEDILDMGAGEDDLFPEDPLESALRQAGYEIDPEKLSRIEAILSEKPAAGGAKAPAPGAAPAKPMAPAAAKPPMGGAVPAALPSGFGK